MGKSYDELNKELEMKINVLVKFIASTFGCGCLCALSGKDSDTSSPILENKNKVDEKNSDQLKSASIAFKRDLN